MQKQPPHDGSASSRSAIRVLPVHARRIAGMLAACLILSESGAIAIAQKGDVSALIARARTGEAETLARTLGETGEADESPGMLYLRGIVSTNGDRALQYFQTIVREFPTSEWADDALYGLYQYSYAIGAYNTADRHLTRLKTEFPASSKLAAGERRSLSVRDSSSYAVQIGVLSTRDDAEELLAEMKSTGYTAEIRSKSIGQKTGFAVWLGYFTGREAAAAFAKKLKSRHHIDAIIVRR